jgi:rhodanese-related sulfurtransferase
MKIPTVAPQELHQRIAKGEDVEILDVRTPAEYQEVHLPGSKNVPLDQLDVHQYMSARADAGRPLYVLCKSGARARMACERFHQAGFTNVILVEGGIMNCERAGLPVQRQAPDIESQVRITIGSANLIGLILGVLINPWFLLICAFVSCGLIVAGVRGKCPLASLLALMPWNRRWASASCCATTR